MKKDTAEIARKIERATVVIGTFEDPDQPGGNGLSIIKGKQRLKAVAAGSKAMDAEILFLPCDDLAEAETYRLAYGDAKII